LALQSACEAIEPRGNPDGQRWGAMKSALRAQLERAVPLADLEEQELPAPLIDLVVEAVTQRLSDEPACLFAAGAERGDGCQFGEGLKRGPDHSLGSYGKCL
jgi:hypothetical protein